MRKKILVAISDTSTVSNLIEALEMSYDVIFANNFADTIRSILEKPDMLILDCDLLDSSGFEVLRHIRFEMNNHDLPVIFLTETQQDADIKLAMLLEIDTYQNKMQPYFCKEIISKIRVVLDGQNQNLFRSL